MRQRLPRDAARAVAITDGDRLRALQGFVAKLAVTNPAGLAEIRRALDAPGPHGAAAPAGRPRDHEAPIRI